MEILDCPVPERPLVAVSTAQACPETPPPSASPLLLWPGSAPHRP